MQELVEALRPTDRTPEQRKSLEKNQYPNADSRFRFKPQHRQPLQRVLSSQYNPAFSNVASTSFEHLGCLMILTIAHPVRGTH
jgi:hypothetical protein